MRLVWAIITKEATFQKHVLLHDEWREKHGCTIETVYRVVEVGERVVCEVYNTMNYFLGDPYYNVATEDGYHCCVSVSSLKLDDE